MTRNKGDVRRSLGTQILNDFFGSSLSMISNCRPGMAVWTSELMESLQNSDSFDIEWSKLSGDLIL